jgi:hypothetical protein
MTDRRNMSRVASKFIQAKVTRNLMYVRVMTLNAMNSLVRNYHEGDKYNSFKQNTESLQNSFYVGESNENRKTEIKIRNIAPFSYKSADMLPML